MADPTWHELVFNSHYQATITARELLQKGKVMEAGEILEDLIEAMGRSEKRAVKSQLIPFHKIYDTYR